MKEKCLISIICSLFLLIISCRHVEKQEILGSYKIDKAVIRDSTNNKKVYEILNLKDDMSFELKSYIDSSVDKAYGNWQVLNSKFRKNSYGKEEPLVKIIFTYQDQEIEGFLKGTIIYFYYPNDLYDGKFSSVLYVRYDDNTSD